MDELRRRLGEARPSNWESWPTLRKLRPWFAALGLVLLLAIPWGVRQIERNLEADGRDALGAAGILVEDISFTGRAATITADLSTDARNDAVAVLAEMGGVARITWQQGSGAFAPPTTTTTAAPTPTEPPEPGAEMTITVKEGRIALRGVVPAARTIKEVGDAAADLWGAAVGNQLFVDASALAHPWLAGVDEAVAVLTTLVDPQLALDAAGATITGVAVDQPTADTALERLEDALGSGVEIDNQITVSPLALPNIQIIAPGDGTVSLQGNVANLDVRRNIVKEIVNSGKDLVITNQVRLDESTADIWLPRRLPVVVATLGTAEQWTLRFDGESLAGSAVGGKAFNGNRVKPTVQLGVLVDHLGGFLHADPSLVILIEVHADPRGEGDVDPAELATQRAEAIAARLVRSGIDPDRITASQAAGEGELLLFRLNPAE